MSSHSLKPGSQWPIRFLQWSVLFVAVIAALWAVTQFRDAPQLILLALLIIITLNFSLPAASGGIGLVPIVSVSCLLLQRLETAVILFIASYFIAELFRPLWVSTWGDRWEERPFHWPRWGQGMVNLLAMIIAGLVYRQLDGATPITEPVFADLPPLGGLIVAFGAAYFFLSLGFWLVKKRPLREFITDIALSNFAFGTLALPVAILGSAIYVSSGIPAFVIFTLGIAAFSVVVHLSWQRRFSLEKRLDQFTALNRAGVSLREVLELATVLERTREQVLAIVEADDVSINLLEDGHQPSNGEAPDSLDDFTQWVVTNGRVLNLDRGNMHFALRHGLTPPPHQPDAWLGIPLTAADRMIGTLVLQRLAPGRPFSQWNREVLLSIAGQASAAIQNARLYSETLRLYNLTDEALARRVEQLQAILNGMEEGVLMIDVDGRIALINPFATSLLDQANTEILRQRLTPELATRLGYKKDDWLTCLQTLAAGQELDSKPATFVHKLADGSPRFITRQESAVATVGGQVMGRLLLFRDVTEEKELAEQRADLTRMIVHDLRNPLTTLLSTLNLVQQDQEKDELLTHARHGTLDMLDMVDSLMDINRMEAGKLVVDVDALHLPPLVEKVVERQRPFASQKRIALELKFPDKLPAVWADAEIMRRVLVNLLDNALKFTPASGFVNVHLIREPSRSAQLEPGVRCIISDTGPGIPADFRERVFDRYMRTNPGGAQVRGTGLGLTFCKLAVAAHNGRIWIEDGPDGGSQFVFTLPGIPIIED